MNEKLILEVDPLLKKIIHQSADVVEVVRCKDCISQRTCFIRDHFEFLDIDNPFCCVGKKVE